MSRENPSFSSTCLSDTPLVILDGQARPLVTATQPSLVEWCTSLLDPEEGQVIVEIGTGGGYQAALLASLVGSGGKVLTFEINRTAAGIAARALRRNLGPHVRVLQADATRVRMPPCDRLVASAGVPFVPRQWWESLRPGGRMVVPLMLGIQCVLLRLDKRPKGEVAGEIAGWVSFGPMRGAGWPRPPQVSRSLVRTDLQMTANLLLRMRLMGLLFSVQLPSLVTVAFHPRAVGAEISPEGQLRVSSPQLASIAAAAELPAIELPVRVSGRPRSPSLRLPEGEREVRCLTRGWQSKRSLSAHRDPLRSSIL
ncbi:MAG: hypothetical protein HY775_07120 [Acidobacteria bacterium]|nr:hypothetical protein [Acidobacteriota bacterium]